MLLSVCFITKNEENNIAGAIESVKNIASEIIVNDTGSTDKTIEIAQSYGCNILKSQWQYDFSKARNTALNKAKGEFILFIDADERLLEPQMLLLILGKARPQTGGWIVDVISKSMRDDGKTDEYISPQIRLFRNHPGIRYSGIVHEQIAGSISRLNFEIVRTKLKIEHRGYLSVNDVMKKQIRNLELLDKALGNTPEDSFLLFQRAKAYHFMNKNEQAEVDILKALNHSRSQGNVSPEMLNYGAGIAFSAGNRETAKERALDSIAADASQSYPYYLLGEIATSDRNFAAALNFYQNAAYFSRNDIRENKLSGDFSINSADLIFRIGRSYAGMNKLNDSLQTFLECLVTYPNDVNCLIGAANISHRLGQNDKALFYLEKAGKIAPERKEIFSFIKKIKAGRERSAAGVSGKKLLSLCMIVKNEEDNIESCIRSAKEAVDEVIVVDTGSEDKTMAIAEKAGAKVYTFPWQDDFSLARNESIKRATGEWILYLDADERLKVEYPQKLREFLTGMDSETGGVNCIIESAHSQLDGSADVHRGGYPRIFRNLGYPKVKFTGRVHEQITPSIIDAGKSIINSDVVIEHLGYNRSREDMEKKIRRNYDMLLRHVREEPLNGYAWFQLGQTLGQMKLIKEAEDAVRFAINCGNLSNTVYASAAATMAQFAGNKKNFEEALSWAEKSLEKAPGQLYSLSLKAYSLLHLGRAEEAKSQFEQLLELKKQKRGMPKAGFDIEIREEVIHKGLRMAEEKLAS
ncbi:MAG: glycosyltransferase [Candidatus Kapaibacterium sp.]